MNNEQINIEAWQIAVLGVSDAARVAIKREIIALCTRVDTEARQTQREADAQKCDAVARKFETLQDKLVGSGASEAGDKARAAEECATSIRNGEQPNE